MYPKSKMHFNGINHTNLDPEESPEVPYNVDQVLAPNRIQEIAQQIRDEVREEERQEFLDEQQRRAALTRDEREAEDLEEEREEAEERLQKLIITPEDQVIIEKFRIVIVEQEDYLVKFLKNGFVSGGNREDDSRQLKFDLVHEFESLFENHISNDDFDVVSRLWDLDLDAFWKHYDSEISKLVSKVLDELCNENRVNGVNGGEGQEMVVGEN